MEGVVHSGTLGSAPMTSLPLSTAALVGAVIGFATHVAVATVAGRIAVRLVPVVVGQGELMCIILITYIVQLRMRSVLLILLPVILLLRGCITAGREDIAHGSEIEAAVAIFETTTAAMRVGPVVVTVVGGTADLILVKLRKRYMTVGK